MFRTYTQSLGMSSSRPSDVLASLRSKGTQVSAASENNLRRLDLLRNVPRTTMTERQDVSFALRKVTGRLNPVQEKFIDDFFPNSTSSKATNRLPLPFNDFDYQKPRPRLKTGLTMAVVEGTSLTHSDYINDMYKHVDRTLAKTLPKSKTSFLDDFPQVHWSIKPTNGNRPEAREGASLCVLDRKFYMFGGQSMTKKNDVRVLNTDNWTWTLLPTEYAPKGRIGHSTVLYKNQLVIFGGWSHYSHRLRMRRCFKKVYMLYMDQEIRWQRFRGQGKVPKARRYHAAALLGWSMLVYGGVDTHSKVLKGLSVLEIETLTWVKPPVLSEDTPSPRSACTLTPVFHPTLLSRSDFSVFHMPKSRMDQYHPNSGFYLFGGVTSAGKVSGELWVATVIEGESLVWRLVLTEGEHPVPRSDHSAALINNRLIIYGGRNDSLYSLQGDCCVRDLSVLNIDTLTWENCRLMGSIPPGRWGHCAAACGSKMVMIGGINVKEFLPSEVYVLETDQLLVNEAIKQDKEREAAKIARFGSRGSIEMKEKYAKS